MKRIFFIAILFIISVQIIKAQDMYRNEIGFMIGGSYYNGDLNPNKHFLQTKMAGGLIYRYNITPRWTFKVSALLGWLEASDMISKANVERNLSFNTYIFDFSPQIEFNFLQYILGHKKHFISPYIFVGASVFNFNPRTKYDGKWQYLHDLGTEGQGTTLTGKNNPYSLTSIAIPFGIGLKISPARFLSLGLEWGIRKTFTDYIDDVSTSYPDPVVLAAENGELAALLSDRSLTDAGNHVGLARGNSKTKDWYVFTGLTATFRIKSKTKKCDAYKQHQRIKVRYKD